MRGREGGREDAVGVIRGRQSSKSVVALEKLWQLAELAVSCSALCNPLQRFPHKYRENLYLRNLAKDGSWMTEMGARQKMPKLLN